MPDRFTGTQAPDGDTILDHVGDDIDFRIAFDETAAGFLNGRPIELAEAPAEGDQILVVQLLAAEEQHQIVHPGAVDGGENSVIDMLQIDAVDFRSQRRTGRLHVDAQDFTRDHWAMAPFCGRLP